MEKDKLKILIVDDEKSIGDLLSEILHHEGYSIFSIMNGSDALKLIEKEQFDLVLLDLKLPDMDGITVLKKIKNINADIAVVMISAFGTISLAITALKAGAEDFIEKPLEANRVITTVKNIIEKIELKRERSMFLAEILKGYRIIGESESIQSTISLIDKCAPAHSSVLILGETGTGKELIARNIHLKSPRYLNPFIAVNCAAIPAELIESELFGYEKGAFTGALARKIGQFEIADRGTLFLDEIGDMSLSAQAKLLRIMDDGMILRLGGISPIHVDARIIAATNHDLEKLIAEKQFRDDLYHRLNVIKIVVPPLKERGNDIITLAENFLRNACVENNRPLKQLTKKAGQFLIHHEWPGNVRELKHLMEKLVILLEDSVIDVNSIEQIIMEDGNYEVKQIDENGIERAKIDFERNYIISALNQTGWHILEAAKKLGVDRTTLFRKMKKLGIKK